MICPVCGNEIRQGTLKCPYCNSNVSLKSSRTKSSKCVIFNLEQSFPICVEAEKMLYSKIFNEKKQNTKVLKVIHGYGSSGVGGELRYCIRDYLQKLKRQKIIRFWIAGEEFSSSFSSGKRLLTTFKWIKNDSDYNRKNKGITLIVL